MGSVVWTKVKFRSVVILLMFIAKHNSHCISINKRM